MNIYKIIFVFWSRSFLKIENFIFGEKAAFAGPDQQSVYFKICQTLASYKYRHESYPNVAP